MSELIKLLVWCLSVYGVANGVTTSPMLYSFRAWAYSKVKLLGYLLGCDRCIAFWAGLLASVMLYSPTGCLLFDGFLASAAIIVLSRYDHSAFSGG
jgi:hypothetical protein|tara:strand:- start:5443 stop:5730 length:288 start_codon:yes stop_codon:yes gene_type:complete